VIKKLANSISEHSFIFLNIYLSDYLLYPNDLEQFVSEALREFQSRRRSIKWSLPTDVAELGFLRQAHIVLIHTIHPFSHKTG
jgi:hypothetical protein